MNILDGVVTRVLYTLGEAVLATEEERRRSSQIPYGGFQNLSVKGFTEVA